ncbi:hypothetical protein [Methanobacterium sp.]|uniref:hypothetical protein n=1 Tax=Methanobacterium sp. TaxID=2164 RepID=UPI003C77F689
MGKFKKPSLTLVFAVFICLSLATAGIVSAAAQISTNKNVNLLVANDDGVRFQAPSIPTDTYNFFSATQTATQGLNALHIASSSDTSYAYGDVTNVAATSGTSTGTFYMTDTGGRGWDDNGILMIAVNGTLPDNFAIQINSAGYQWTPISSGYPTYNSTTYNSSALSETFTKSDFDGNNGYTSTWKPCPATNYPLYEGQNVTVDTLNGNTFHIIFVDLYAGIIGQNTLASWNGQNAVDNGALQVNYTINNLPQGSMVAFNSYAYCQSSNQGNGIRWTNSVNNIGNNSISTSGWNVASWFT